MSSVSITIRWPAILWLIVLLLALEARAQSASTDLSHPRLYGSAADFLRLRQHRDSGRHEQMWSNLIQSADWCLTKTPRTNWIAPMAPDPVYENLYDRFYAIMGDMAIMEHLAFAYALSGNQEYGEAARKWVLSSCRVWQHEADGIPDGGKAYAVSRLLKGVAVAYDLAYDRFTDAEREEIRAMLVRVGRLYFEKYFQTAAIAGPGFHTHHAIVEWSSFGVLSLTLLNETPEAQRWLAATVKKFEEYLLPEGLAPDGAQTEGGTFWASTMQYRIFFMDALRHVTGRDLFKPFEKQMNADLALASIATAKNSGYDQGQANVVLEPHYGQLDYYAPVLLFLAREYHRPIFQYLALWDHTLGQLQKTRAITPHGEQLLFDLGGYAYIWYDPAIPVRADEPRLAYTFPSVNQAFLRASWKADDLLAGVADGLVVIHAGGQPILIEQFEPHSGIEHARAPDLNALMVEDDGRFAAIRSAQNSTNRLTIILDRPEHKLTIRRVVSSEWQWWYQGKAVRNGTEFKWGDRASLRVVDGEITGLAVDGYVPAMTTGFNKLKLVDPASMKFPVVSVRAAAGKEAVIEIRCKP